MKLNFESQTRAHLIGEQIVLQLRQRKCGGGTSQTVEAAFQWGRSCLLSLGRRPREVPSVFVGGRSACGYSLLRLCQAGHGCLALLAILLTTNIFEAI